MIEIGLVEYTPKEFVLEIKDKFNNVKAKYAINDKDKHVEKLMDEHFVEISFELDSFVGFVRSDYILYNGRKYILRKNVTPDKLNTYRYRYELMFEAEEMLLKDASFYYLRQELKEASFNLTTDADSFMQIVVDNANRYFGEEKFKIGVVQPTGIKHIFFDQIKTFDALIEISKTFNAEFLFDKDYNIHLLNKANISNEVELETDISIEKLEHSETTPNIPYNRIIPLGSIRNLPANYRAVETGEAVDAIYQKRLRIPLNKGQYIDAKENMSPEEVVEGVVVFDNVYPHRVGTISNITTKEYTDTDESTGAKTKWNAYRYKDKDLQFKSEYLLDGVELRIVFQSGNLNGMDFAIKFNPDNHKEDDSKAQVFEIIRNEDYSISLPNNKLHPNEGDAYILYGFDIKLVNDKYIPEAEEELYSEAIKWIKENYKDTKVYECPTIINYFYEHKLNLDLGQRIKLVDNSLENGSRSSRIIGFEKKLINIYDAIYTVGDNIRYSNLSSLKEEVKNLKADQYYIAHEASNKTPVITQYDSTKPTDRNVLSSLRSLNTFLRKDQDDSTEHLITFLAGLKLGAKYSLDKNGNAALNNIKSSVIESLKAKFHELESTKLNSSEGTINTLTALTLFVKNLADVQKLDVKETATILNAVIKGTLSSPKFVSGFLGEGFRIAKSSNGDWNLEIDNLTVRKVFQVFELLIQEVKHQGGVVIHSPAGGKITKVTDGGSYWKCEVEGADTFYKDDLVLCQKFTGKNIKRYWRLATSAGDGFVNLSKTDCEANSAIPEVDDEIATLGNKTNTARQSAYLISVVGADAPYTAYYSGINSYSLKGKEHTRIGNLEGVVSPAFGPLKGSGALLENAYIQGIVKLQNGKTVETVISESSSKLSSDIGKVKTDLKGDISKSKEETKGEINSSVSSVRNELNSTIAKAEEQFNTGINQTKTELSSNISSVKQDLEGKINTDIQVSKESITKQITQSKQEAEAAAKAYTDAQDKAKLTQAQSYADGKVATEQKRAIEDVNAKLTAAKSYADAADAKLKTEQQAYADGKVTATEEKLLQTANDNLAAAKAYAEAQDEALKVKTDAYADGKITAEEKRAIADANAKLAAAKKYAEAQDNLLKTQQEAYADGKVTEAEKRAIADATNKVNKAKNDLDVQIKKEITSVRTDFQIAEGQINGKITETTQLINEAKKTNGETKKTLEQTSARINQFDITAKKIKGTLGEITKKQEEVESSITNLNATANSLNASVNGFKETEQQIKATANKIEATHEGIVLEASEKSAKKAIDGLEIGGRNYFAFKDMGAHTPYNTIPKRVGDTGIETTYTRDVGNTLTINNSKTWKPAVIENNTIIAVSGYIKINGNIPTSTPFQQSVPSTYYAYYKEPIYAASTGYFCLFANTKTNKVSWIMHVGIKDIKKGDAVFIDKLKLEKGNKPTDWSPAPEDIDTQFTETKASLKVLNDKLVAEVSKTKEISKDLTAVKQDHNSFKVQVKSDITGAINSNNEVIKSSFEMKDNKISLLGAQINITGKVTFKALDSSTQSQINTAGSNANNALNNASKAQSSANTANSNANKAIADAGKAQTSANSANSSITALKGSLKSLAYLDKVEKAKLGTTLIEGGFLKTDLLRASSIKAEKLDIEEISDNTIVGGFVFLNGSMISQEGIDKYGNLSNDWRSYKDDDFTPNLVMKPIDGSIKAMKGSFGIFDIVDESIVGRNEVGGDEVVRFTTLPIPEASEFGITWSITSFKSLSESSVYNFTQDNQTKENTYKKSLKFTLPIQEIGEYQLSSVSSHITSLVTSNGGANASSYVWYNTTVVCTVKQGNTIVKKVEKKISETYDGIDIDFYVDNKKSCDVELDFTIDFYSRRDGAFTAHIDSSIRAVRHKKTPRQSTVIGKDGLYTSFSTLEFLQYKSGQGFTIRAGNYGFRITKEGIQKWSGGKWVTANI